MKVVIDTNVLVSALLFGGTPGGLIPLWKDRRIGPLCSKGIVDEYLRVLAYPKFHLSESELLFLVAQEILPWFEVVAVSEGPPFVPDDPEDDKFVWCALAGKADVIVSGDEHLLSLASSPVRVLSPASVLAEMRDR
jgi:uncharacterized protein